MIEAQRVEPSGWEHFVHGGGLGLRGRGPTLQASFEQAALALSATVCPPSRVRACEVVHFDLGANDTDALLAEWLRAVLGRMQARGLVLGRFLVRVDGDRLVGRAWGEPYDRLRHGPARPRRRTVQHAALGHERAGDWSAQAVLED